MGIFLEFLYTLYIVIKSCIVSTFYTFVTPPLKSVKDEIVFITGAGSGLGRLMALEFAKKGAKIVACDIDEHGNEETARLVGEIGGICNTFVCDISDREAVYKLADDVQKNIGHVDILINNAGIVSGKNFLGISDDKIQKTMDVNVMAHFWTIKSFLPSMISRNHGHIVTIASSAGFFGVNQLSDYCASKFANVGFTETLDQELHIARLDGIHTTTICPYFINTGMFEGCKPRFPGILAVQDQEETVQTIVRSVQINQRVVLIPKILYFFWFLKTILPYEAGLEAMRFFGATKFMDTFVGRRKQKEM